MSSAITPYRSDALAPDDVLQQVRLVQEVMNSVMKSGEHYGTIPGCGTKPALLQPGAQVLAFTFRLAPDFGIELKELEHLHREYLIRCSLVSISTGQVVGMGIGICSTMESKYRYRNVADFEVLDEPIPTDSKERKKEYRAQGFGMKKVDDQWVWVKYGDSARTENPDLADVYNTVLKIASKRAFVHAVLNATAASDMFTQDIEDLPDAKVQAAPLVDMATDSEISALEALRADLGFSDGEFSVKLNQAGATSIALLTSENARRLISNLGQILQQRADKPAPAPAPTIGEDDIPF